MQIRSIIMCRIIRNVWVYCWAIFFYKSRRFIWQHEYQSMVFEIHLWYSGGNHCNVHCNALPTIAMSSDTKFPKMDWKKKKKWRSFRADQKEDYNVFLSTSIRREPSKKPFRRSNNSFESEEKIASLRLNLCRLRGQRIKNQMATDTSSSAVHCLIEI